MKFRMLPIARREMLRAGRKYDGDAPGTGDRFLIAVGEAFRGIVAFPLAQPSFLHCRKMLLGKFPFAVIYVVSDDLVLVIAVAHGKRRPGYWRWRLDT